VADDRDVGVAGAQRADGLFGRDAVGVAGLDDHEGVRARGERLGEGAHVCDAAHGRAGLRRGAGHAGA
jgi:hypothetical protein